MELHEFTNAESFYGVLTQRFLSLIEAAIASRQRASVALSGGRTPEPFYRRLNQSVLPWKQILWIPGDERWVPTTSDLSNERMTKSSLGSNQPDFSATFLSWHQSDQPETAAKLYEEKLLSLLGAPPILDLALLGLGEDGHTASLFPGTAALNETRRFAVLNHVPQMANAPQRLTLTYPVFNAAREIWFLVSGADKSPMVERLLQRDPTIPSSHIQNPSQHLYWLK